MDTFIAELDFLFDEKGLLTVIYQLYTNTRFALKYNKSLMLGDITTRDQITSVEKIFDDKHQHARIAILHDNFIIILTNTELTLRINNENIKIPQIKDFLIFDDQNWCFSTNNSIIKMFNNQQVGVVTEINKHITIVKINDLLGVLVSR